MSLEVLYPLKLLHSRVWYINRLDCNLYDEIHTFNDLKRDMKAALAMSKLLQRLMVCSYKNNIETTSSYSCAGTSMIDTVISRQMIVLESYADLIQGEKSRTSHITLSSCSQSPGHPPSFTIFPPVSINSKNLIPIPRVCVLQSGEDNHASRRTCSMNLSKR